MYTTIWRVIYAALLTLLFKTKEWIPIADATNLVLLKMRWYWATYKAHFNVFLKRRSREFLMKYIGVQIDPCLELWVKERSTGKVFKKELRRNFPQALSAYRGFPLLQRWRGQLTIDFRQWQPHWTTDWKHPSGAMFNALERTGTPQSS